MCLDDGEFPVELDRSWRKARKEHRCFACLETIRKGDRYHHVAQVYDGEFATFAHCVRCMSIIKALWAAGAETVDWSLSCGETWEENFGALPDAVAALAFLTPDEAQAGQVGGGGGE